MYKIGTKVVHRSHGIGSVVGIENRQFGERSTGEYLVLEILDGTVNKKVFVASENASERLRPIMDRFTAVKVKNILNGTTKVPDTDGTTWNRRYREYMEVMHSGDALGIATVVSQLRTLKSDKDLSFGERKLLEQGERLIETELGLVE
jgi:CarD family transcriptional regulator